MAVSKEILKTAGRTVISGSIIATHIAKYGVSLSCEVAKTLYGGALNLANSFAPVKLNMGIGEKILNGTQKLANKGFDELVNLQEKIRSQIR